MFRPGPWLFRFGPWLFRFGPWLFRFGPWLFRPGCGFCTRLHEQGRRVELVLDGLDMAAQHRGEVGVGHGGVASGHEADKWIDPVAGRDVLKADFGGDLGQASLVLRVAVAVQQHDGG